MRPSYIALIVMAAAAAAAAVLGPLRGRSVEAGLQEAFAATTAALDRLGIKSSGAKPTAAAYSPPTLSVSQPIRRRVMEWDEYVGRFEAVETVDVRARVSGYLAEVKFTDGEDVTAGELLFTIDPRPFERALDQAKAQLNQAEVSVSNARLDVERGRPLLKSNYISRKAFDDRENLQRDAEALVKVAEARVKTAELELSFCRVVAPISGRISRTLVTPGNFVSGGGSEGASTVLTTIVRQDPIYIYFDVSENNALKYQRMTRAAGNGPNGMIGASVGVGLPDETAFPHNAKLDFFENRLDQGTGTLRARAILANGDRLFSSGMFARVRLQGSPEYDALLLPDEAIGTDQATRFVYVVGDDDIPVRKIVKLGPLDGGLRVVRQGLDTEDWVILRGQQRVRADHKIIPRRVPLTVSDAAVPGDPPPKP